MARCATSDLFFLDRNLPHSPLAALFTELAERPESGTTFPRLSAPVTLSCIPLALLSELHRTELFSAIVRHFDANGIFGMLIALVRRFLHDTAELECATSNILI